MNELREGTAEGRLGVRARRVVEDIVGGSALGHDTDEFLSRAPEYHEAKAVRHLMTSQLMRRGDIPADGEGPDGHLHRAITRLVMADRCHGTGGRPVNTTRLEAALSEMIRVERIGEASPEFRGEAFSVRLKTSGSDVELLSYHTVGPPESHRNVEGAQHSAASAREYFIKQIAERLAALLGAQVTI